MAATVDRRGSASRRTLVFVISSSVLAQVGAQSGPNTLVEDNVSFVGNTGTTLPTCQVYSGGACANGGVKLLVADAPESGLIAHYTFDDSRGSDSSGHGNHALTVPMAGPGHGPTGAGAWFDGTTGMMQVPHVPAMNSPDLTIAFWMYLLEDSTNSYRTVLRKAQEVTDMTPAVMLLPNERRLHVRLSTTTSDLVGFDSSALIPLRRWTHVALVLRGGAALSLYVNGVKDCPQARGLRRGDCPPSGVTYAWPEGDVRYNTGPFYVGADPFMSGTAMFMDSLKLYRVALLERDLVVDANSALGTAGTSFLRLGCANCTAEALQSACSEEIDGYHPCLCQELMSGGLLSARTMGWLRGDSRSWQFHADVRNLATCDIVTVPLPKTATGFCCRDS